MKQEGNLKNKSFWQDVKRFFEPLENNYWLLLKLVFRSIIWSFFVIFTIEVFKYATFFIQKKEIENLKLLIIIYLIFVFLTITSNFFMKYFGAISCELKDLIQRKYMSKFFLLKNNEIEKIGTGKLINIAKP